MKLKKGFTLIELLVVVSIISLLTSIVMSSLNQARAQARDVKARAEFSQVQKALMLYFDKYGKYPNETRFGASPWTDNFDNMASQLVAEGFLTAVPVAPANHTYAYYNYVSITVGALLKTTLETITPTTTPPFGSCRPFINNWCSTNVAQKDYCICSPY
ncbi:MAG: type II secretion system GspH family protein [bacterium]|nr:type II secretion system GspH family protein [bacterium]